MRKYIEVQLMSIPAVQKFSLLNQRSPCEVRVFITDDITVPGDSIMSLFSINLLKPLKVEVSEEDDVKEVEYLLQTYTDNNVKYRLLE